jgi:ketosteroid isomerase-like protein
MDHIHDSAASPTLLVERFVAAFNVNDLDGLLRLYAPGGILVPVPGQVTTDRRAALAHLLSFGAPMHASVKRCYVAGTVALLVVDWAVGPMSGTAVDVARWDGGAWRYLVDNPHGVG